MRVIDAGDPSRPCVSWLFCGNETAFLTVARGGIRSVLENVAGLALERLADGVQRGKADRLGFAVFQDRDVGHRDADPFGHPLRISFRYDSQVTAGKTYDLLDWPYGNKNLFEFIEVPSGSKWDLTKIYTTGEARLIGWPVIMPSKMRKFYQSDLDLDADVDSADLLSMLQGWTGADYLGPEIGVDHGDVDGDGDLDSGDLLVLMSQWTGALAAEKSQTVPEPAGLVLAVLGLLTFARSRRH